MTQTAFVTVVALFIAQLGDLNLVHSAEWDDCPNNFSVYTKCGSVPIEHDFCSNKVDYNISICQIYELEVSFPEHKGHTDELSDNADKRPVTKANETCCKVNATVGMISSGVHNVTFIAAEIGNTANQPNITCVDHITANDTILPPSDITLVEVNCYNFTLSWQAPDVLPGYEIYGYSIEITDENKNIVYKNNNASNATSIEIEHHNNDLLIAKEEYTISIRTLYCGGISNESAVYTFRIIDTPRVKDDMTYLLANSSKVIIIKANVDVNCPISHPTSVLVELVCREESHGDTPIKQNHTITINSNGDIIFDVRYNSINKEFICDGSFNWTNGFDYQLQNISLSIQLENIEATFELSTENNLKVTQNECFISCCCITKKCLADHLCEKFTETSNITRIVLSDYHLPCDGKYSLSCHEVSITNIDYMCLSRSNISSTPKTPTSSTSAAIAQTNSCDQGSGNLHTNLAASTLSFVILLFLLVVLVILGKMIYLAVERYRQTHPHPRA